MYRALIFYLRSHEYGSVTAGETSISETSGNISPLLYEGIGSTHARKFDLLCKSVLIAAILSKLRIFYGPTERTISQRGNVHYWLQTAIQSDTFFSTPEVSPS